MKNQNKLLTVADVIMWNKGYENVKITSVHKSCSDEFIFNYTYGPGFHVGTTYWHTIVEFLSSGISGEKTGEQLLEEVKQDPILVKGTKMPGDTILLKENKMNIKTITHSWGKEVIISRPERVVRLYQSTKKLTIDLTQVRDLTWDKIVLIQKKYSAATKIEVAPALFDVTLAFFTKE